MNEDAAYICKRFIDLSKQANRKGIVTFSDFLTVNEQQILQQNRTKLESEYQMSGGYDYAERQMVAFIPDALFYEWDYPVQCIRICPAYPKFAEKLSHRDVLGALMSLGIERSKIGDLIVNDTVSTARGYSIRINPSPPLPPTPYFPDESNPESPPPPVPYCPFFPPSLASIDVEDGVFGVYPSPDAKLCAAAFPIPPPPPPAF